MLDDTEAGTPIKQPGRSLAHSIRAKAGFSSGSWPWNAIRIVSLSVIGATIQWISIALAFLKRFKYRQSKIS